MKETKFKQTEVGMIPNDWEVKTLGSVYRFKYGIFNNNPDNGGPFPIYGANGIIGSYTKYNAENSVVIGHIGTAGTVIWAEGKHFVTYNGTIADIKDKSANDSRYGYFQLLRLDIPSICNGSSQPFLAYDKLNVLNIPLPPTIEEQQRIANALSDVDTLIANLEKLIAKKKNIKQGAMQQLLTGKKRLPGFGSDERQKECHSERSAKRKVEESNGYKMTELGMIPSDWEVKTFGELFDILPNNTLSRAELNEDSGSFKNVHYGDVLVKFPEWIDCSKNTLPFINSGAKFNHTALQDGDVIIADTAEDETVGKSTEIYNVGKMKIVSGLHTIPIRPKKKFASKWLGYFINSACWHDQILPFITGTKVSAISKTAIAETKFFYPAKIDEQTAIANILSDMDAEIATLETKLAKYRTLKTGMMQQLLTGKIRIM